MPRYTALLLIAGAFSMRSVAYSADFSESSSWIAPPNAAPREYGVFLFRKSFDVSTVPEHLTVHITADQRYRLLVNGVEVSIGPSAGNLKHWRYETVDVAPHVKQGKNVLSAVVWNMGEHAPACQISHRTAFRLQAASERYHFLNSSPEWRVDHCPAYAPLPASREEIPYYYVVGPGDRIDSSRLPWDWCEANLDDRAWASASVLSKEDCPWQLIPRPIPLLERKAIRFAAIRRTGGFEVKPEFVTGTSPITIPANASTTMLLDNGELTNAYPQLLISGGAGSSITFTYAESLRLPVESASQSEQRFSPTSPKGDRNEVDGKAIFGNHDEFLPDGGEQRLFRPLWFRTYRYVELKITTRDEPLTIHDFTAEFTGYPLEHKAWFRCDDPALTKLQEVGWRTLRLCSNETQYDCPYYERLQYVGDTRTQACFLRYLSGDDRLPRQAIQDFSDSIDETGLSQSRYPCKDPQSIPPYSLYWISMLHDDWMWRGDADFIRSFATGIQSVLAWHKARLHESGMLGTTPGWRFVDWSFPKMPNEVHGGVPPYDPMGRSAVLSLQLACTYREASDVMRAIGEDDAANRYAELSERIAESTRNECWNDARGLLADVPNGETFSQHANILGVLTGAIPVEKQKATVQALLGDDSLTPATVYFRFYLNRALEQVGLGDRYLETLQPWQDMLDVGLTTFAETPEPTLRSDCHAWGSSPEYEFLRLVAGIRPSSPGFQTVEIAPHFGNLKFIDAGLPTPRGTITVNLRRGENDSLAGTIQLPDGMTGHFRWQGKLMELQGGANEMEIGSHR